MFESGGKRLRLAIREQGSPSGKRLQKLYTLVRLVPKKFSYPRDEDDEPYINLAGAAAADFIVSRDNGLLDLMTGHADECKEFRQRFRPLRVIEAVELLRL